MPAKLRGWCYVSFVTGGFFLVCVALVQASTAYEDIPQAYSIRQPENTHVTPAKVLFIVSHAEDEYLEIHTQKIELLSELVASHWQSEGVIIDDDEYTAGLLNEYEVVFYINESGTPAPPVLINDLVHSTGKRIFLSGFTAAFVNTLLQSDIATDERSYEWIEYKDVRFSEGEQRVLYDVSAVAARQWVTVHAIAGNDGVEGVIPAAFTIHEKRFGFFSRAQNSYTFFPMVVPSTYAIDTYSIVFLDLLHEVLGSHESVDQKYALLRLEDINSHTYRNPDRLRAVYTFLKQEEVPFHIALIPRYLDPANEVDIPLDETRRFHHLLQEMVGEGYATPVQHGYTHQFADSISGVGFEFWDEQQNTPLANESREYVTGRILGGQQAVYESGLPIPDIWETPHYTASTFARNEIARHYPIFYERHPAVGALPFAAKVDGEIYIPENLGFVSDGFDESVFGLNQSVEDIEENLRRLEVFRDPVASVFWHPWRDMSELEEIVRMMKENGYTFVSAYDLLEAEEGATGAAALSAYRNAYAPSAQYQATNVLLVTIYAFFIIGCFYYARTALRLTRYLKIIGIFKMPLSELSELFRARQAPFPTFAIFVPARNEGLVIGNTLRRLAKIDYPKEAFKIIVIVDEREQDDDVEVLTKDEVMKCKQQLQSEHGADFIHYLEVPRWYSGVYDDLTETHAHSTKGRALNFALQMIQRTPCWADIDMIGVLDADGRLHPNVLKEAAYNRVLKGSRILQGPVFQVSNFKDVSIVGVAAGLELAIHHITELPSNLLKPGRVQFLAGTNYFIDKNLIVAVGGWDQHALVEDAELALRAYVKARVVADWIGSPEIEQTPQNFSVYKKQRSRWVRGHLDLIRIIQRSDIEYSVKARFFWKIFTSQFRFVLDLGIPLLAITFLLVGVYADLGSYTYVLSIILLLFAVLMWDLYGSIYRRIGAYIDPTARFGYRVRMNMKLFIFSPVFMFVQSIPRMIALKDYLRSAPTQWYKTERTREQNII